MCLIVSGDATFQKVGYPIKVYKPMYKNVSNLSMISPYRKYPYVFNDTYKLFDDIKSLNRLPERGLYSTEVYYGYHAFLRKEDCQRYIRNNKRDFTKKAYCVEFEIPAESTVIFGSYYGCVSIVSDTIIMRRRVKGGLLTRLIKKLF